MGCKLLARDLGMTTSLNGVCIGACTHRGQRESMGEQIRSREQHSRAFGSWTRDLCQRKMTGESLQLRCCRSTRQRGLGSLLSKHRPGFACLILLCRLSSADTSSAG
eukprot:3399345-Rhodomonas_salina.1